MDRVLLGKTPETGSGFSATNHRGGNTGLFISKPGCDVNICSDGDLLFDSTSSDFIQILEKGINLIPNANSVTKFPGIFKKNTGIKLPYEEKKSTILVRWNIVNPSSNLHPTAFPASWNSPASETNVVVPQYLNINSINLTDPAAGGVAYGHSLSARTSANTGIYEFSHKITLSDGTTNYPNSTSPGHRVQWNPTDPTEILYIRTDQRLYTATYADAPNGTATISNIVAVPGATNCSEATWHPDGDQIAFISKKDAQDFASDSIFAWDGFHGLFGNGWDFESSWDLYVTDKNGSNMTRLTTWSTPIGTFGPEVLTNEYLPSHPRFHPDGDQLLFLSAKDNRYRGSNLTDPGDPPPNGTPPDYRYGHDVYKQIFISDYDKVARTISNITNITAPGRSEAGAGTAVKLIDHMLGYGRVEFNPILGDRITYGNSVSGFFLALLRFFELQLLDAEIMFSSVDDEITSLNYDKTGKTLDVGSLIRANINSLKEINEEEVRECVDAKWSPDGTKLLIAWHEYENANARALLDPTIGTGVTVIDSSFRSIYDYEDIILSDVIGASLMQVEWKPSIPVTGDDSDAAFVYVSQGVGFGEHIYFLDRNITNAGTVDLAFINGSTRDSQVVAWTLYKTKGT